MERSPPAAPASGGAATPDEQAQEEEPRRRSRVPRWTGFGRKTLWDWLQLLIVPAILIGVTFAWSATQTRSDNNREDRRIAADRAAAEEARRDATLQGYLAEMSGLMLDKKLLTSTPDNAVRAVARTVTLTALRRLDGQRKVAVVRFLSEAGLIRAGQGPLVRLSGADLRGADFRDVFLEGLDLSETDLTGANLQAAFLLEANLDGTNLSRAQLTRARLADAMLAGARLVGAYLARAYLRGADLQRADLQRADLHGANLGGANLLGADLQRADLHGANLQRAFLGEADLTGADLTGAFLSEANLVDANLDYIRDPLALRMLRRPLLLAEGLDLDRYIADLTPEQQKEFLDTQEAFLDFLSREELSQFNLTPEKLARHRGEASGG